LAVYGNGSTGVGKDIRRAVRHGVQDDKGALARQLRNPRGRADRAKIEDARTAGYEDEVRGFGGGKRNVARVRGAVDNGDISPASTGRFKGLRQACGRHGHNDRRLSLAAILPPGRTRLWIKIDHGGQVPGLLGCDGKM